MTLVFILGLDQLYAIELLIPVSHRQPTARSLWSMTHFLMDSILPGASAICFAASSPIFLSDFSRFSLRALFFFFLFFFRALFFSLVAKLPTNLLPPPFLLLPNHRNPTRRRRATPFRRLSSSPLLPRRSSISSVRCLIDCLWEAYGRLDS